VDNRPVGTRQARDLLRVAFGPSGIALAIIAFFGLFVLGFKAQVSDLRNAHFINDNLLQMPGVAHAFAAIVAILILAHEYRYGTIIYSLTSSNSRSKVLFSKIFVITLFSFVYTLLCCLMLIGCIYAGNAIAGHSLSPQEIFIGNVLWRTSFFIWGYAMVGLVLTALFRNMVAAIVGVLIVPNIIEALLQLVLKENVKYLPFNSLGQVLSSQGMMDHALSPQKAALIFMCYLLCFGLAAWILFVRRDAN
jgi:ABC-type transport system involved in multi-copper enzyme maturation permease subunit